MGEYFAPVSFEAYFTIEVNGEPETAIKKSKLVVKETKTVWGKVLRCYIINL